MSSGARYIRRGSLFSLMTRILPHLGNKGACAYRVRKRELVFFVPWLAEKERSGRFSAADYLLGVLADHGRGMSHELAADGVSA